MDNNAIRWVLPSKHASILTDACEIPVTATLQAQMEQAWASMEAMLLDAVLAALCAPAGKIDNPLELLEGVKNTRSFQAIVNNEQAYMQRDMRPGMRLAYAAVEK